MRRAVRRRHQCVSPTLVDLTTIGKRARATGTTQGRDHRRSRGRGQGGAVAQTPEPDRALLHPAAGIPGRGPCSSCKANPSRAIPRAPRAPKAPDRGQVAAPSDPILQTEWKAATATPVRAQQLLRASTRSGHRHGRIHGPPPRPATTARHCGPPVRPLNPDASGSRPGARSRCRELRAGASGRARRCARSARTLRSTAPSASSVPR